MYTVAGQGHRNFNFGHYMIDDAEEEMDYEDENDAEKRQEMDYEDDVEDGHSQSDGVENNDDDDNDSVIAPPYSPISDMNEEVDSLSDNEMLAMMDTQVSSGDAITEESSNVTQWNGYKFVGDNLDKNLRPSFQCNEKRGLSVHCFHGYAVKDRINFGHLSELCPVQSSSPDPVMFVPSDADVMALKEEFGILVS